MSKEEFAGCMRGCRARATRKGWLRFPELKEYEDCILWFEPPFCVLERGGDLLPGNCPRASRSRTSNNFLRTRRLRKAAASRSRAAALGGGGRLQQFG